MWESTYCTECRGLDPGGPCICQPCWEPPLATVSRVRHILCTQSDNLTATPKHRCEGHTAGDTANQTRSMLFCGGNSLKPDKPPFQIKAAANICPGIHHNCLDLTHGGCAATACRVCLPSRWEEMLVGPILLQICHFGVVTAL